MWWQRRPTRSDRRRPAGDAPGRGAWQRLPAWAVVVGVPLVLAVGYALPMLGVSLMAVLAFDWRPAPCGGAATAGVVPTSPVPADTPDRPRVPDPTPIEGQLPMRLSMGHRAAAAVAAAALATAAAVLLTPTRPSRT